jgi:hypothetical protein
MHEILEVYSPPGVLMLRPETYGSLAGPDILTGLGTDLLPCAGAARGARTH